MGLGAAPACPTSLVGVAEQSLALAHTDATRHGAALAERLREAA